MDAQLYWNEIGSTKDFEDPLYLEKLSPFLEHDSKIVEYGCGYGRLLKFLHEEGYQNLIGFDFAENMIKRGHQTSPHLELVHLPKSGLIPTKNYDCVILSTILCTIIDKQEQMALIQEIMRILKPRGVLYLSDFMISDHPRYNYREDGIYTTSEQLTVRHHTTEWIMELLRSFNIQWFEQFNFKTMNQNVARTFHCIGQKI